MPGSYQFISRSAWFAVIMLSSCCLTASVSSYPAKAYNAQFGLTSVVFMTVVDVILIIVIILSALFSLMRGFVKEAISLATWIIAIWLAATFTPRLAAELPSGIESEAVRQAVSFGVLFVLTLMVGALVNTLVSHLVKKTGLSGADRIFGVLFGVLRGGLIILVFVVVGGMTPLPESDWWQSSVMLEWFESTAIVIQDYIPQDLGISYQPANL